MRKYWKGSDITASDRPDSARSGVPKRTLGAMLAVEVIDSELGGTDEVMLIVLLFVALRERGIVKEEESLML